MPIFLGIHKLPPEISEADAKESWEKYKSAARAKGLKPLHVNYNAQKGFAYCETEAATAKEVQDAHSDAQIPFEEIVPVATAE